MVKKLLFTFLAAIGCTTCIFAQTAYVGLSSMAKSGSGIDGTEGRIVSFDVADPSAFTAEYCKFETSGANGDTYVKVGESVGDTYYAFVETDFAGGYFCSMNFEGNEVKALTDLDLSFMLSISDMAYDAKTSTMYGVKSNTSSSTIYTVNLADGALTEYCTLDADISAITYDGEGNMYGIGIVRSGSLGNYTHNITVYSVDIAAKTATKEADFSQSATTSPYVKTAAFNEGKIYFTPGAKLYVINTADWSIEAKDFGLNNVGGLTFTKSTAIGEGGGDTPEPGDDTYDGMVVKYEETYGSVMGDVPEDMVAKRTVIFYNKYNLPIREARYGRQYGEGGYGTTDNFQIMSYTTYEYNEKNQLVSKSSEQYGQYSGEDYAFKATEDTVTYYYDENGRLVEEYNIAHGSYKEYTYDDEGQLIHEADVYPDTYNQHEGDYYVMKSKTYSDFVAFNLPRLIVSDGVYESDRTVCDVEYDAENRKVKATTWNADRSVKKTVEYWNYEGDMLVEYLSKKVKAGEAEGEWIENDNKKTVYSLVDNDPNKVSAKQYDYFSGEWTTSPYHNVTTTAYMNGAYAPTELTAEQIDGEINSYAFSFAAPNIPVSGTVAFDIYRHGEFVKRVALTDNGVYDPETGRVTVTDNNLPNGRYDYMVQPVVFDEITGDSTAYNVSNNVIITPYVELPSATNFRVKEYRYDSQTDEYYVTVTWDAPENVDEALMFKRYNVFETSRRAAENNDEDGLSTEYTFLFRWLYARDFYVQTVYHYGKVNSDTITIDPEQFSSIKAVTPATEAKISVNENEITIDGVASQLTIFSTDGKAIASHKNVDRVDISALGKGVHLAIATIDGKNVVVKFTK